MAIVEIFLVAGTVGVIDSESCSRRRRYAIACSSARSSSVTMEQRRFNAAATFLESLFVVSF